MCVHSLITRLQLKKMSIMYESAHDVITFQLLEMSSITTSNQKQFGILAQGTFFKGFLGIISAILRSCIMKKINLEVTCKRNRFGYWNLCKRLPNFVNVVALVALAQAGLVAGPFRPSATLLWCQACVVCNSKSFHSLIFKICSMM